jgi:hypothetical protein
VADEREKCGEAATDLEEPGGVLIVDIPRDVGDAPPVPPGFSIRGTANDVGVLEIGSNKSLIFGGIAAAGAVVAGVAVASKEAEPYAGPQPFEDLPGIEFVSSNPPPESTLSLSSGTLSLHLRVYSLETMMGATVTADLAAPSFNSSSCIILSGTHDLRARENETVVLTGPTQPNGGFCDTRVPLEEIRVRVVPASGLGGFRTGIAPLHHLRVLYYITE